MNKTAFKIFICFTLTAAVIATILLGMNFLGFAIIGSDTSTHIHDKSPQGTLKKVSESLGTDSGFEIEEGILPPEYWCILINENGDVIWSQNNPGDIPEHYSINDVAKMTRWFLNDYPVYVRTEDYGLLVLGIPKNAVGKYDMAYSMEWFDTLPHRIIGIFILNLCLAALLAFVSGINLYRRIRALMDGINDLRQEKRVHLKEKGLFKELAKNINHTSETIERKNEALASRDSARSNWISGISHDIRTPLSIIMGYSEALSQSGELSENNKKKTKAIANQSVKIKKLIEDLNLISSLEYDMQPSKKTYVKVCPLVRRIVTDTINSRFSDNFDIELDLRDEKAAVSADEHLLERAIFNIINNNITHNSGGCKICISEYTEGGTVILTIADNGKGVSDEVIENIGEIPKSAHGLGLPMAYRIVRVHGGRLTAINDNGFTVKIELPEDKIFSFYAHDMSTRDLQEQ